MLQLVFLDESFNGSPPLGKYYRKKRFSKFFFSRIVILFQYIGTMDVPRPSSRVEIVAAMRRVRVCVPINTFDSIFSIENLSFKVDF